MALRWLKAAIPHSLGVGRVVGVPGLVGAEEPAQAQRSMRHRRCGLVSARWCGDGAVSQLEHLGGRPVTRSTALGGLVLVEPVLGDQLGHPAGVEAAGHVVAGGDRAERAGVVDEAGGAGEAGVSVTARR